MVALVLLWTWLGWTGPTQEPGPPLETVTADVTRARTAWEAGVEAYEAGDFATAVVEFERAYRYSGRSGPLFSLGQAHRHLWETTHDPRQRLLAIDRFGRYLELDPDGRRAPEADRWIRELQRFDELEGLEPDAPPTRLGLSSVVEGAVARIDDGPPVALPTTPDVAPGLHTVIVEAPRHVPARRTIEVPEGSTVTLEVGMVPVPGTLRVTGPSGAQVRVDGRRVGVVPLPEPLQLEPGSHEVIVSQSGRASTVRRLDVEPASDTTISASLPRTGQRTVALVTIGLGGAAVAASAGLSIAALATQQRAQHLDDALRTNSLTGAENRRRAHLVAQRDDLRTAAIATGVVGAGAALAGLVLFLTERSDARPRVALGPRPTGFSAELSGRF